jgi:tRNA (guanine37-N1)-methyltransferase
MDGHVDEEVSLGDYVLAGGEVAAAAAIEGVARLLPGVVGNPDSTRKESFRDGLLEEPVYTRPAVFEGVAVPEVLLSGDHGRIERWRKAERLRRTAERRPDLMPNGKESDS